MTTRGGGERELGEDVARGLGHPRARFLIVLGGFLLALPTVAIGFFTDDWFMLGALRRHWSAAPPWWDLYDFVPPTTEGVRADIASGALPWWTAPSLHLHLVRPLASALLAADERLFGAAPLGWHLHSIAWWVALLAVLAALFRRIAPGAPRATAALALLLFTVAPEHTLPYGWPSARHVLVGAAPAFAGLLAHLAHRQGRLPAGRWLAPLGVVVGLAASEAALGVLAFWFFYDLLGPRTPDATGSRARAAAVPVALTVAYLLVYALAGGGTSGGDAYVSPLPHVGAFLAATAVRLPMLLGNALLGVPVELAMTAPHAVFVAIGLLGVALLALLYRGVRDSVTADERAALRWLVPGALVAIVGACGGLPGGRVLLVADVGTAYVLAVLLRGAWARGRSARRFRVAAFALGAIHLGLAPVGALAQTAVMTRMAREGERIANALPDEVRPARRVFLLAGSDPVAGLYVLLTMLGLGRQDLDCIVRITSAKADYRVTRQDARTLAVAPVEGALVRSTFETLYRSRSLPFAPGDRVSACGANVEVAAVDQGSPTRLVVTLPASLDDPGVAAVAWDGSKLAKVSLAVGETRLVRWVPGPMQSQ